MQYNLKEPQSRHCGCRMKLKRALHQINRTKYWEEFTKSPQFNWSTVSKTCNKALSNRLKFVQAEGAKRARLGYKKWAICRMHDACEGGGIPVGSLCVCLSVGLVGLYLLPGAWTDRAETWWDDQGHPWERPKKEIFWIRWCWPGSGQWATGASSRA